LVGGNNRLKPALRLMTDYRLMIEEIKDAEVITSYTRWVEAVQVRATENQGVYLKFSPRFERIWLESKRRLIGEHKIAFLNTGWQKFSETFTCHATWLSPPS
jgi:hypothetical protein